MIIKANNSSDERFFPAITKRPKKIILIKKGNKKQIYSTQDLRSKKNKQIKERRIYITYDDTQKQASPTERWNRNDSEKLSRSKSTFSETRVITPDSNRVIHPDGKHPQKENEEDPCGPKIKKSGVRISIKSQSAISKLIAIPGSNSL